VVNAVTERNPVPDDITLSVDVPDNLPPVFFDELQLKQVLTNLVTNAYQAMPEGGELSVSSKQCSVSSEQCSVSSEQCSVNSEQSLVTDHQSLITDNCLLITIQDTGIGIPPEDIEKIFEPLFTTKARGIGLGLAICEKLVAANGGKIDVESQIGEGTTFCVWLPIE